MLIDSLYICFLLLKYGSIICFSLVVICLLSKQKLTGDVLAWICACLCDNLFEFCLEYAMFVVLSISFYSLPLLPALMNFAMSSIKQMGLLVCHVCVGRWLYHPCFSKLFCWWIVSYFHLIACGCDIFYILHNLCFVIITADGLILCLVCVGRWLDWTCFSQLFYYEM